MVSKYVFDEQLCDNLACKLLDCRDEVSHFGKSVDNNEDDFVAIFRHGYGT
jgi:hypothetical protein